MEVNLLLGATIVILIGYLLKKYCFDVYDYWRKRGVPTDPDSWPLLGNAISIFWTHKTFGEYCNDLYRRFKGRSMVGFYQMNEPKLLVCDPELLKTVLVSEFAKFQETTLKVDPKVDPLVSENPFFHTGEKWKTLRHHLSYALMSSKRLKILVLSVDRVCGKFAKYLGEKVKSSPSGIYKVELKALGNLFTGEVVASAGFGAEGDFFANGSGPNSFREHINGFLDTMSLWNVIQQTLVVFSPNLGSLLKVKFLPLKTENFFRRVVKEMIALRKKDGVARNDFLQLMLDNEKSAEEKEIDYNSITASATSFFLDGYETSAITWSFLAYQVAAHPEVQEKLRKEVTEVLARHGGAITYESVSEMTYLDQTLNESMRSYTVVSTLARKCTQTCTLVGNDGVRCVVEAGTEVVLPIQSFHRDPDYWKDPETFSPERFSEEGKKEQPKMVFTPFGDGPRICVGMRFALMQVKGAMATMIKHFSLEVSKDTKVPLVIARGTILNNVEGGLWINLRAL